MRGNFPCSIIFRYWRKGKMQQLQADIKTVATAIRVAHSTGKKCDEENIDWVAEILPFAGEPIVYGTRFGIEHQKTLF